MKQNRFSFWHGLVVLLSIVGPADWTWAQGTAFTYQGRLDQSGVPYSGSAEFQATLWNVPSGGTALASNSPLQVVVTVTNGLFVLPLNFGSNFPGADRWLQLEVRTSIGAFNILSPRQPLTPAPYAITAGNLSGSLPATQLSGTIPPTQLPASVVTNNATGLTLTGNFTGNGANLTGVDAATLGGISSAGFWKTTGNAGTTAGTHFLGTTDDQPLEIKVNNVRAFRLETSVGSNVNIVGGWYGNSVSMGIKGATISGGGGDDFFNIPYPNRVESSYGTISGGGRNTIQSNANFAIIAGGGNNSIQLQADYAIIAGGLLNTIRSNASSTTIGGGRENTIEPEADFALIAGGWANKVQHNSQYATIGGGRENLISTNAGSATIGGGFGNRIGTFALGSTIAGGVGNQIRSDTYNGQIAGGTANVIESSAHYSLIAGGIYNSIQANAENAAICGGWENIIQSNAWGAIILGGRKNSATNHALAAGNRAKANHTGAFVWADSAEVDLASSAANSLTLRASGGYWLFTDTNATTGAFLAAGSGSWTSMSDRNAKENFRVVDVRSILEKVVALPLQTWNYKSQETRIRHIGPMAQDFRTAFDLGESDTGISTVDADGVALAAIQALNQKLEEENAALKTRMERLEQLLETHLK